MVFWEILALGRQRGHKQYRMGCRLPDTLSEIGWM